MTVLITGANRGIGRALLDHYRTNDVPVMGTTRVPEAGDHLVSLEVTNQESHSALAEVLSGRPIELLVCNAGVYLDKGHSIDSGYAAEIWAQTFAVNVTGVFLTVQSLLPNLQAAPLPKIAIIASKMGSQARAPGGSYIYRASKAAAVNLGRNLASDLRPQGIAVGVYHPGWVRTDMGSSAADISVEESARGLADRFDALSLASTGCFEGWDGEELPL